MRAWWSDVARQRGSKSRSKAMQRSDVLTTERPQLDGEPAAAKPSPARLHVITLEEFVQRMPLVQPPCAYRLSLDSGVEFNNVKHAFEQPMAVRLDTWLRLLRSLASAWSPPLAARTSVRRPLGRARADRRSAGRLRTAAGPLPAVFAAGLPARTQSEHGRAGSPDRRIDRHRDLGRTGRGLLRNVARVCEQLACVFRRASGRFRSVDELWALTPNAICWLFQFHCAGRRANSRQRRQRRCRAVARTAAQSAPERRLNQSGRYGFDNSSTSRCSASRT